MWSGPCGVILSKNTDITDAHGLVFSRIGYSCAAFSGVVLMRRRRGGSARILSHAENLSMRARFSGHAPKGQKFIAQGKQSDALGIRCRVAYALQGKKY